VTHDGQIVRDEQTRDVEVRLNFRQQEIDDTGSLSELARSQDDWDHAFHSERDSHASKDER
jgi:hypothetical protein